MTNSNPVQPPIGSAIRDTVTFYEQQNKTVKWQGYALRVMPALAVSLLVGVSMATAGIALLPMLFVSATAFGVAYAAAHQLAKQAKLVSVAPIRKLHNQLNQNIQDYEDAQTTLMQWRNNALQELEAAQQALDPLQQEQSRLNAQLDSIQNELSEKQGKLKTLTTSLHSKRNLHDRSFNAIDDDQSQPLPEHPNPHATAFEKLEFEIAQLLERQCKMQSSINELAELIENKDKELKLAQQQLEAVQAKPCKKETATAETQTEHFLDEAVSAASVTASPEAEVNSLTPFLSINGEHFNEEHSPSHERDNDFGKKEDFAVYKNGKAQRRSNTLQKKATRMAETETAGRCWNRVKSMIQKPDITLKKGTHNFAMVGYSKKYPVSFQTHAHGVEATLVGTKRKGQNNPTKASEDRTLQGEFAFTAGDTEHKVIVSGVLDGHGGPQWSSYVKDKLIPHLQNKFAEMIDQNTSDDLIVTLITHSFVTLNNTEQEGRPDISGSTASIALHIPSLNKLFVANAGDSRSVIVTPAGHLKALTVDHLSRYEDNQAQVTSRGGAIKKNAKSKQPRVGGSLAVTKGFGDFKHKGVSAKPDITIVDTSTLEAGTVLAHFTDGVIEQGSSKQVAQLIHEGITAGDNLQTTAVKVVELARQSGSRDDTTIVLRQLNGDTSADSTA